MPQESNKQMKARRAFKACLHCRNRKAKCDLGDIDCPKQPPCARCRREGRECTFAPSKRGGRFRSKSKEAGALASADAEVSSNSNRLSLSGQEESSSVSFHDPVTFTNDLPNAPPNGNAMGNQDHHQRPSPASLETDSYFHDRVNENQSPVSAEYLAAANLRNPGDAVNLLVLASEAARQMDNKAERFGAGDGQQTSGSAQSPSNPAFANSTEQTFTRSSSFSPSTNRTSSLPSEPLPLSSFPLIAMGILTEAQLVSFVEFFYEHMHNIFPITPYNQIPRTREQLVRFAEREMHLLVAIVIIASRHEKDPGIHDRSWQYFKTCLTDIMCGKPANIGTIEALLLLSEYLPRPGPGDDTAPMDIHEHDRMAWMLVGNAVRLGYMMGLDQKTFVPPDEQAHAREDDVIHRERLAWTYCYIFDRQISIRVGKAFWSRGPGLCFQLQGTGYQHQPSSDLNFPTLRSISGKQDDFASLMQAYVELTQIMSSAHDMLYPSKDRTMSLVRVGEYYKYLDAFARSINGFRMTWEKKEWGTFPLSECVAVTFHYVRLYISSFAFQAHVQRAAPSALQAMSQDADNRPASFDNLVFPRGVIGSPDAKFILEGINAATELLKIGTDRFYVEGALPYIPYRFYLFFSHAAVFLLKAVFLGVIPPSDHRDTIRLLKRLIYSFATCATDEQHGGIRHARLLNGLLRMFMQGRKDYVESRVPSPGRRGKAPLPPVTTSTDQHVEPQAPAGNGDAWSFPNVDVSQNQTTTSHVLLQSVPMNGVDEDLFGLLPDPVLDNLAASSQLLFGMDPPPVEEFTQLLSDQEALDNDFWRSLSMQGDWNFGDLGSWQMPQL